MATQTREQILENWVQAAKDFYSCYQLLAQHQHLLTNCPTDQLVQMMETMHTELIYLTAEAGQLNSTRQLIGHTKRLQKLIKKAKVILWLAGVINN